MSLPVVIVLALLLIAAVLVVKRVLTPAEDQHSASPAPMPRPSLQQSGFSHPDQQKLLSWLVGEASRLTGTPLERDGLAMQRLSEAAAKALDELEANGEAEVNLPYLTADSGGPKHFVTRFTRDDWRS